MRIIVRSLERLNWNLRSPEDFNRRCCNILFYLKAGKTDLRPPPCIPWLAPPRHVIEHNQDAADAYDAARDALSMGNAPPSAALGPPLLNLPVIQSGVSGRRFAGRKTTVASTVESGVRLLHDGMGDVSRVCSSDVRGPDSFPSGHYDNDTGVHSKVSKRPATESVALEPVARRTRSRLSLD